MLQTLPGAQSRRQWSVRSCLFCLKTFEAIYFEVLNEGIELLLGVFIFVSESGNSNADLVRDVSDSVEPHCPVEAWVDSDLLETYVNWHSTFRILPLWTSPLLRSVWYREWREELSSWRQYSKGACACLVCSRAWLVAILFSFRHGPCSVIIPSDK